MRTLVFDLDGTLVDSAADIIAAANGALSDLGHGAPIDPVADAATAFRGGRAILTLGLSRVGPGAAGELEAGFARFLHHYAQNPCRESRFYPGARAALARLRAAGTKVAICTNKPEGL
ncbi:MAG TPA: HAD family hydrolase, partial [Rhodobacterales bacterium]|nr:HAD family hydrolase [Rhodobacterales bacterium]